MVVKNLIKSIYVLDIISKYLQYEEYNHLATILPIIEVFRPWKLKQKKACQILKKFIKLILSNIIIKKKFINKLFNDKYYRRKYLFIHEEPSPHICLKKKPPYFLTRGIKEFKQYKKYMVYPTLNELEEFLSYQPIDTWQYYLFACNNLKIYF